MNSKMPRLFLIVGTLLFIVLGYLGLTYFKLRAENQERLQQKTATEEKISESEYFNNKSKSMYEGEVICLINLLVDSCVKGLKAIDGQLFQLGFERQEFAKDVKVGDRLKISGYEIKYEEDQYINLLISNYEKI